MKLLLTLVFLVQAISAFPQKLPLKFGEIPMDQMTMRIYEHDSSASAVIIFDKGVCSLDNELNAVFKRHTRIKFFTTEAFDTWANETLFLSRASDAMSKLNGSTYNIENGKIVESKMDDNAVFKSKFDRYSDQVKFTLPNVKAGSVIEYSYTIRTTASLLPPWQFQHSIPTIWSEFETYIPSTFSFRKDMQGFLSVTKHEVSQTGGNETWIMEHSPAFKEEPFLTNPEDYISRIDFYLSEVFIPGNPLMKFSRTWPAIAKDLAEDGNFGLAVKGSPYLKKYVETITIGMSDENQKLKAIFNYVKENVEWNKTIDKIPDHSFKTVLEDRKGSSSEINLLLVSMLQKAGFEASPVLISTRDHGRIRPFIPMFSQFNDVICLVKIDDKTMLIDGTDRDLPMNALPRRCLNGEGLIVTKEDATWIPITTIKSKTIISSNFKIDHDGVLDGQLKIVRDGNEASTMRKSYNDLGQKEYITNAFKGKSVDVEKSDFKNITNANESVTEIHDLNVTDHAQVAGSVLYINPYLLGKFDENPFKMEKREYPVDFASSFNNFYLATFELPADLEVEELPKQKVIVLPDNGGKFSYSATLIGDKLNFVSQLSINKSVFMPEEYPVLKEFYDQVIAKQAEQIVLKKK